MSESPVPLVRLEGAGKRYRVYASPSARLLDWLSLGRHSGGAEWWGIRGVSLQIRPGEAIGVVGPNGAGKTTLLRLVAGLVEPTEGTRRARGRLLPLLALGTGMRAELTGRENVSLAAALLGLPAGYAEAELGRIEAFAELGDFFDRPLAFYSRGMKTRLAFALIAFAEADLFVFDEALAGGDGAFREKCHERLDAIRASGAAVILATHQPASLLRFCERALVLRRGAILWDGEPHAAVAMLRESKDERAPDPSA